MMMNYDETEKFKRDFKKLLKRFSSFLPTEQKIVFLEIYFKTDQENERKERIADFIDTNKTIR
jgi:hypothetical protein